MPGNPHTIVRFSPSAACCITLPQDSSELPVTTQTTLPSGHGALQYRPDIDGLRAIAVLAVVLFHAFPVWLKGGFVGVDIFFVISGFLISGILIKEAQTGRFSILTFYQRRVRRIFPALILVLLFCSVLAWFILLPGEYQQLGKHVLSGVGFVANLALWAESGYFDTAAEAKPLLHLWSLGVEEQFYIVWPWLIALCWRSRLRLWLALLSVAVLSLLACLWWTPRDATAAFYAPYTRFWELLAGSALAYWAVLRAQSGRAAPPPTWLANSLSFAGLALMAASCLWLDKSQPFPGWRAALPVLGAVLVVAAGQASWLNRYVLSNRLMVGIGLISFPLYLWHWPLLAFAHVLSNGTPDRLARALAVAVAILLAWVTYELLEKPVRYRYKGAAPIWILLALSVVLAAWGGAGMLGWVSPRHVNPDLQRVLEASRDWDYPGVMATQMVQGHPVRRDAAGARVTLLVGDSHVEQYAPRAAALRRLAPERLNTTLWSTIGGCPPIESVVDSTGGFCSSAWRAAQAVLASQPVDAVVVGGCWNCYFVPPVKAEAARQRFVLAANGQRLALDGQAGRQAALASLQAQLQALARRHRVYLLLDNPQDMQLEPARYIEGSRWSALHLRPVSDVSIVLPPAVLALREQLREVAARAGVTVIDPLPALCQDGRCPIASAAGELIYKDNNHLRASYVRSQASFLDTALLAPR